MTSSAHVPPISESSTSLSILSSCLVQDQIPDYTVNQGCPEVHDSASLKNKPIISFKNFAINYYYADIRNPHCCNEVSFHNVSPKFTYKQCYIEVLTILDPISAKSVLTNLL